MRLPAALVLSLLCLTPQARAQQGPRALGDLAERLSDAMKDVRDAVRDQVPNASRPNGEFGHAAQLADGYDGMRRDIRNGAPLPQVQATFVNLRRSWTELRWRLYPRGACPPRVDAAVRKVDALDAQFQRAVGVVITNPNPGPGAGPNVDFNKLTHDAADAVRRLAEDINSDYGRQPWGQHLLADCRELAEAIDEAHEVLHNRGDRNQARAAYSQADRAWHHLEGSLNRRNPTQAVLASMARVNAIDAQIHQALELNVPPPVVVPPGPSQPGSGFQETRRLAYSLHDRAESLLNVCRGDMPDNGRLIQAATNLAWSCDQFHDGLRPNLPPNAVTQLYSQVASSTELTERELRGLRGKVPPRIVRAWQGFVADDVVLRRQLGLPVPPDRPLVTLPPVAVLPPVTGPADALNGQIAEFMASFLPNARKMPKGQGPYLVSDAERLRDAALAFRQAIQRKAPLPVLAESFQDVDILWQRLLRRYNRTNEGKAKGPNHRRVIAMGDTLDQIRDLLGLPGVAY